MAFKNKAAVVVVDGFGLLPGVEWNIVTDIYKRLNAAQRDVVLSNAGGDDELARATLAPTSHGVARVLARKHGREWQATFAEIRAARETLLSLVGEDSRLAEVFVELRREASRHHHYAPWAAQTPSLYALRQEEPSWITRTAGVFTGHVKMEPEIMGNSDTGHQQIFNLVVARQIPAALAALIESGEFFNNEELNRDLSRAREGATVVFKTLLSGEHGDDGFVHSAWPHMEAFFKLYFEKLGLPASQLQVEAVLDGRDSPFYSSMQYEEKGGLFRYGFLRKLRKLLLKYNAEQSLRWILGRQFMDRDYKGGMIRREYELVTKNEGRYANCLDAAFDLIQQDHAAGFTDPQIEPIVIGNPVPVGRDTVFFNAIFRADRQEPITAALLGEVDFIRTQAEQKRRLDSWDEFTWLRDTRGLTSWSMIEYHEAFRAAGAKTIYVDAPHPHNLLHLLNEKAMGFHFLFLTEGVKEKHMGLFSRGRRSTPLVPAETQHIISTCSREEGIESDNDLWKVPQMRHPEITAELVTQMEQGSFDLLAANFPGPDMLGHLIENHFEACLETLHSIERALVKVVRAARENGWVLVHTADHGNVEHYGPDHGNNDVLTSVILPEGSGLVAVPPPGDEARLFDISWTILETLGLTPEAIDCPAIADSVRNDPARLIGSSLVRRV
jgi:2,3-bisphosphoglycerate-independent phosphoglycerate mutase